MQVIALLIYPIITRLYAPEDFGLVSLFLSITGILSLFATAEFQYSIVLPKSESKAIACFSLGFFITLAVVALLVCTLPFSEQIADIFNAPNLAEWYWAVPVFVLLSGSWTLLNYWYTRHKQFRSVGNYQMTQSVTNAISKCAFGYAGLLSGGLILSAIIAPFIALCVSIVTTYKDGLHTLFSVRKEDCKIVAKEYANFPKYSLPRLWSIALVEDCLYCYLLRILDCLKLDIWAWRLRWHLVLLPLLAIRCIKFFIKKQPNKCNDVKVFVLFYGNS